MILTLNKPNRSSVYLPSVLFFLFTFIYFCYFAPHIFYFQEKSSLFIFSSDFLKENLQQPGGLLIYLSIFLTSFSYYPIAGSLISSAILILIIFFSSDIIRRISGKKAGPLPYLIALALFCLQTNYQYLFVNNLGLMLQLAILSLTLRRTESWLPVILFPVWYFLTGGFALVFLIIYTFSQIAERPVIYIYRISLSWLIFIISFYISKEFLFFQSTKSLLTFPWSPDGTGTQGKIFIAAVILISLLPLLAKVKIRNTLSNRLSAPLYTLITSTGLLILLAIIGITKNDRKTRDYFHVEKLFVEKKYKEVIDFNLKNPSNNTLTSYLNNIALCETGKLNDLLFSFPQSPDGKTLFLKWEIVSEILKRGGYFYYCTGMINEAHRWAFEYMVMRGLNPEGLKMIIKTELINGNHKTASKYNDIIIKTLFYRKEAKEFEKLIFNDAAVDSHPELGQKRRLKVRHDFFSITEDPMLNIERVIATDSLNRQAFEYKLAWLLINKDYPGIANEWVNLDRYNFGSIPVHMEEAGIALKTLYNLDLPARGNLRISSTTEQKFTQFLQVFEAFGSNPQTAESELRKRFGNTFWYYVFYK